jgi:predicted dehydrogenase
MSDLRAGVVGLGMMGRHHVRALKELSGVELVAVHDEGLAADEFAGVRNTSSLQELIAMGVDYCVVAVPTGSHAEVGVTLADARVSALIEKPIAESVEEARSLCAAFDRAEVVGAVGHIERFNAAVREMRRRITDGQIGEVFQIATRRQGPFPGRIADVGVVKDLATHDIDLTAWITGHDYADVAARTTWRAGRSHEDVLVAVGVLEGGALVSHTINWLTPFKERSVTVLGEGGALVANTLTSDLTFYANGSTPSAWDQMATFRGVAEGEVVRYAFEKREPLMVEHEAFRDAVARSDSNGIVTLREGSRVLELAELMISDGLATRSRLS